MAHYMPKTLAKVIYYIAYHSPGEFGLFWDADGSMPWKEFYWALQEDASLRFVRQSHVQELNLLNLELPVRIDGNLLRLQDDFPVPAYPIVEHLSYRLFFASPRKQFGMTSRNGLRPTSRPLLAVASSKELALRIGRRRDSNPLLIDIDAAQAAAAGIAFYTAGPELYLVAGVPLEYLQFPYAREDDLAQQTANKSEKIPPHPGNISTPGSYLVDIHHFQESMAGNQSAAGDKKAKQGKRKGPEWKREVRKGKDRWKRNV
jgi:putative RNA 2'-phosphotransferase